MAVTSRAHHLLGRALQVCERVQVELQGQYSIDRLAELQAYIADTSVMYGILLSIATPIPCLVTLILLDITPLRATSLGVDRQTPWFWFRLGFAVSGITCAIVLQLRQSAPSLPMSRLRLSIISLLIGVTATLETYALGVFVGFPTPFVAQLLTSTFLVKFTIALGISWGPTLRRDPEVRANFTRYLIAYGSEVGLLFVYPVFYFVFSSMSGTGQTAFSLVLPVLKIFFKNWASYGMLHMEDLAPTTIVFNIDVFHALFVSPTMQKSKSIGATMAIMTVDFVQLGVMYYEIKVVVERYEKLSASDRTNALQSALRLGDAGALVQKHPLVALPRHLRRQLLRPKPAASNQVSAGAAIVAFSAPASTNSVVPMPTAVTQTPRQIVLLAESEKRELQKVRAVLKLLHMIEFYVLTEYVEVMVAAMYTVYLAVITNHSNHVYYPHLNGLPDDLLHSSVRQVAFYALLELLSFVVFCVIVDRKVQHFSTIRQLGFALRKHWQMAQVVLLLWVIFVIQMQLEHAGTDYTFEFAWLRNKTQTS